MKNKIKALLLASIVAASALTSAACAEQATEAATEKVVEAAAEEAATEAAAPKVLEPTEVTGDGAYAMYYASIESSLESTLAALCKMTPEEVQTQIDSETIDDASRLLLANWQTVQEELGQFKEVTEYSVTEEGTKVSIAAKTAYDGVKEGTVVTVNMTVSVNDGKGSMTWDVQKPKSQLFQEAGLNTLLGLGTVFVVLVFLSFLIGQIHWIPDLLNKKKESAAPAPAAPAPAAPVVEEEEELVDDTELIAVIAAAIAASEQTSTDGFVVRSIRKVNKKNWQNA